jgi:RNA polymerase sigma-70 factor (ECF subfamily)
VDPDERKTVHASAAAGTWSEDREIRLLVLRAKLGDREAVDALYRRYYDPILAFLTACVGNRHDAEDLTTQTFVRMIESLPRFKVGAAPFSAWLYRIARNLAVDHFRSSGRAQPLAAVPAARGSEQPSAEDLAMRWFGLASILRVLRVLPEEQQQVVLLKFVCGLGNAEVARTVGKSEGAVKALQHRALDSLQRYSVLRAA